MSKLTLRAKNFKHLIKFIYNNAASEIEKEEWQVVCSTYADITSLCDSKFQYLEHMNFGHLVIEAVFLFKLRYLPNISSNMRISHNSRQFEIKRIINPKEQNRYLQIITLEI